MAGGNIQFQEYLANEVRKVQGIYVPIHAGIIRRLLVRKTSLKRLHPNPDDEFCFPKIGPNYEIVSNYEKEYRRIRKNKNDARFVSPTAKEPLTVERIRPDGYMIMNGHHRWAAAYRTGLKQIPVKIVNLTQESDIRKMLEASGHNRRVTLDLDEVVFQTEKNGATEKPLPFPLRNIYRERLRLGIPALFRYLGVHGYDVWVFSANYYSLDYIRNLFRMYHAHVAGIVTGTARKAPKGSHTKEQLENRMKEKYPLTLHIDNAAVTRVDSRTKTFAEFPLSGNDDTWSKEIMDVIGGMETQK